MYNNYYADCMSLQSWLYYSQTLLFTTADGVRLSLRGTDIANDSYVHVLSVSDMDNGLICHTDKTDCCGSPNRQGDWYFPDRTRVGSHTDNMRRDNYFSRERGVSVVRLVRVEKLNDDVPPPERGRFYCEVPNANGVNQTIYVNIGEQVKTLIKILMILFSSFQWTSIQNHN